MTRGRELLIVGQVCTFANRCTPSLSGSQTNCYSAPIGVNWQRVEIDSPPSQIITFCNVNCQGSGSALQSGKNCFTPATNCAIGSL